MHMETILPIPILRITIVRESQLSAGFAGKSRNRGSLKWTPYGGTFYYKFIYLGTLR